MIECRPFRNSDLPHILSIWRSMAPQRGLIQPLSSNVFEQLVLSKSYFDPAGLIVATENHQPLGFVHAAFGSNPAADGLDHTAGVIALLLVRPDALAGPVPQLLLDQAEAYLQARGARFAYAHGCRPHDPFYHGLYVGSEILGLLASDPMAPVFQAAGYQEVQQVLVMNLDLSRFKAQVDRRQVQLRRRYKLDVIPDPLPASWWEACVYGHFERIRFEVRPVAGGPLAASVLTWDMLPTTSRGIHPIGLVDLHVVAGEQRQGLATFLLGEAFRHLHAAGMLVVEVQVPTLNTGALGLFEKLGFSKVDLTLTLRKNFSA